MATGKIESKSYNLQDSFKDFDHKKGIVAFYFAAWTLDRVNDIILKTAYDKTLKEGRDKIYHNNNHKKACGKPIDFGVDEKGAFCVSQLAIKGIKNKDGIELEGTFDGNDTYQQYLSDMITGHSQEYVVMNSKPYESGIRVIREMKLYGVTSCTDIPAHPDTPTIFVKSMQDAIDDIKTMNDLIATGNVADLGQTFCKEYKKLAKFIQSKGADLAKLGIVHCENCKTIIVDEEPEVKCAGCGRFINSKTGKTKLIDKNFIQQFKL